jgi:hypothetical protein
MIATLPGRSNLSNTIFRQIKTLFDYTEHRSGSLAGLVVALSHHDNFISTNRLRAHHFVYAMNERKEVAQSREAGGYGWYSLSTERRQWR